MPYRSISVLKNLNRSISVLKNLNRITATCRIQNQCTTCKPRSVTLIHSNVTNAVKQVMDAMHAPVYFETYDIKGNVNHLPWEVVDTKRKNKVCLNGRLKTSLCNAARKELNLFASLVNCFSLNSHVNVDIVVIRENTEGEYGEREHQVVPGVIESFQVTMTKFWSDRIAEYAFGFAQLNKRKKVTAVHNNKKRKDENVMKLADAFFLESCQEVAKMYPSITYEEISVDNCCLGLVEKPERVDVIVTPNLYGNLIANIASGVAGRSNGDITMHGGNFGAEYAVFEQVGSVGNHENLVTLLFSSVMMVRHLQLPLFAHRLETALKRVVSQGKMCRNGNITTQEVVDAVIANLD